MHRLAVPLFCVVIFVASSASAAEKPKQGKVSLTAKGKGEQVIGWPVVVELTLTNSGTEPIGWWCGGPDVYPAAEHFTVEVRYGSDSDWHEVKPTNGQYVQGSGTTRQLKPGDSVAVPLAIPVINNDRVNGISFRIVPRDWHVDKSAKGYVQTTDNPQDIDHLRARVIMAALTQQPAFDQHLASTYADAVVVDTLLKLVTVDNAPIVAGATRVLARQTTLPESTGSDFAIAVRRWLPRTPRPEWGGLREYVAEAALKSQNEAARQAVIEALSNVAEPRCRLIAINALRLSPGDGAWLRRARGAIIAAQQASPEDVELKRQTVLATNWLDARLNE